MTGAEAEAAGRELRRLEEREREIQAERVAGRAEEEAALADYDKQAADRALASYLADMAKRDQVRTVVDGKAQAREESDALLAALTARYGEATAEVHTARRLAAEVESLVTAATAAVAGAGPDATDEALAVLDTERRRLALRLEARRGQVAQREAVLKGVQLDLEAAKENAPRSRTLWTTKAAATSPATLSFRARFGVP